MLLASQQFNTEFKQIFQRFDEQEQKMSLSVLDNMTAAMLGEEAVKTKEEASKISGAKDLFSAENAGMTDAQKNEGQPEALKLSKKQRKELMQMQIFDLKM